MNKQKCQSKAGLVPRLRFPEFRDAGEWEMSKLGNQDVAIFLKNKVLLSALSIDTYVSTENILPDFGGITMATKLPPAGTFTAYESGDILIANIRPYLKKIWVADRSGAASNDVIVVRSSKRVESLFLASLLKNEIFITYIMKGAKGVKMPRGDISLMKEYPLALPSPAEQQHIADCLSSLDALISAQAEKIDTLKQHKKGLMQQLFPREGETVPRLRFPEFRDAAEWEEKPLSQISTSIFDGTHQTPTYTEAGIPFFSVENIVSGKVNKFISKEDYAVATNKNKPENGDILITRIGKIGFSAIIDWDYEFAIYVTLAVIKKTEKFDSHYLHYFLQSERYQIEILSKSLLNAVPCKINMDELRKTKVLLPNFPEQQKIAACLSSLDTLITAHTEKLNALKQHKKGLMQQLFPSPEAVGA